MRAITTLILISLSIASVGQDLKKLHADYIEYCNTVLPDTVINQRGTVISDRLIPVFDACGKLIKYQTAPGDTAWDYVDSVIYRSEYRNGWFEISNVADTLSIGGYWPVRRCSMTVYRKVVRPLKMEQPSQKGFYNWVYKQISQ